MKFEAFGNAWKFGAAAERSNQWVLSDTRRGTDIAVWHWSRLNGISEADALNEKCRFHGKLDNSEVTVESQNVFPFGGESVIDRSLVLRDKLMEVRLDVKPGRGEAVRTFELEKMYFPGEFTSIKMIAKLPEPGGDFQLQTLDLPIGGKYESITPFALLVLTGEDGFQIEMGCSGDWWRMLGAGNTRWSIERSADGVAVNAKLVDISEAEDIERRPWRFNYYLSWGRCGGSLLPGRETVLNPALQAEVQTECFRAPAVRKLLRKLVRQQQATDNNILLKLPDVSVCDAAGHLERPGKKSLRHWDLDELFALYSWGNRALGDGRTLRIELPENSVFRRLPSSYYLSNAPGEASVREI